MVKSHRRFKSFPSGSNPLSFFTFRSWNVASLKQFTSQQQQLTFVGRDKSVRKQTKHRSFSAAGRSVINSAQSPA